MSDRKIMKFPHCDNLLLPTGSSTTTTTTTTTIGEVCEDIWPTKKCQRRKNKGKCNKNWVAKHCQLTCEYCDSGSTTSTTTTTATTTTVSTSTTTVGAVCSNPNGFYANPSDSECKTFIQCAWGTPYVKNCPGGTVFDPNR